MKVLQISSETGWRGGERQVSYLASELASKNIQCIVAGRKGSALEEFCVKEGIEFIPLRLRNSIDVASALALKQICRKHQIDLVHAQTAISHSIAVISSAIGNQTPLIISRRVAFSPRNGAFTRWKYNHPSIKKILCVSDKTKEIIGNFVRDPDKLITVYSGIDLDKFVKPDRDILRDEYGIPEGVFRIGNASALDDEKDYFTFIRTIGQLKDKGFPVHGIISGKGPREAQLKSFASSLGLENNITFTGYVKNIQEILYFLDVFMLTSTQEGLGTAILDAFATGAVVVATATGGIPELVRDGETGLLAPVGDYKGLALHLESLILDPSLKLTLKEAAAQHVKYFSLETTVEKTVAVYQQVLTGFKSASPDK